MIFSLTSQPSAFQFAGKKKKPEPQKTFVLFLKSDPANSVEQGKTRSEVLDRTRQQILTFKTKLENWAKQNKFTAEQFSIRSLFEALGGMVVLTTQKLATRIAKMKEVGVIAEDRAIELEPLLDQKG